jgi:predicted aconitase with swiveling domain
MKFSGKPLCDGRCEGEAVVTKQPISFASAYYKNLIPGIGWLEKGKINEEEHELYRQDMRDKILFIPTSAESTLGGYMLLEVIKAGIAPKAIVAERADTLLVSGICLARIWGKTRHLPAAVECASIFGHVKTGCNIKIDGGLIETEE